MWQIYSYVSEKKLSGDLLWPGSKLLGEPCWNTLFFEFPGSGASTHILPHADLLVAGSFPEGAEVNSSSG